MYRPMFSSARQVRAGWIDGQHWVELLDEIEAIGVIDYRYLFALHRQGAPEPIMWVSAEKGINLAGALFGGDDEEGPLFTLGAFVGGRHENYGPAPEWGDLATFEARALAMVKERLPSL